MGGDSCLSPQHSVLNNTTTMTNTAPSDSFTALYFIIAALSLALHMAKRIKSNTDGPWWSQTDNRWYALTTPLLVALCLALPDVGLAMGFNPNAWAAMAGWTGGSLVGGMFDMKAGGQARKSLKAVHPVDPSASQR